jgi:uncharacterized protein YukE
MILSGISFIDATQNCYLNTLAWINDMKQKLVVTLLISIITASMFLSSSVEAADRQIKLAQMDAKSPPPASASTEEKIKVRRQMIRTMKDQVEQTTSSVQSGNYGAAKNAFESALKKWYTFGGTIKRLSPETYQKVAAEFKAVNTSIHQSRPPQKTVVANLQTLTRDVSAAVKISDAKD